jgi:hypothetical protein
MNRVPTASPPVSPGRMQTLGSFVGYATSNNYAILHRT